MKGQFTRREVIGLFGAGVGLGIRTELGGVGELAGSPARQPRWRALAAGSFQRAATGAQTLGLPRGAIIRTILKDVDPNTITGTTLMHEHLGNGRRPASDAQPSNPTQDLGWMTEELKAAQKAGLGCIVAAQTAIPGPEVADYLKQLSERTGLHIVPAGAYYTRQTYPPDVATKSEDEIADGLAQAATTGRFGAFGEIGVANDAADLAPEEKKIFRAFGKAQVRTGLPIFTHTNYSTGPNVPMDMGVRQLDLLESVGARPQNIAIGHVCCLDDPTAEVAKKIARRGALVAFDRVTRQQQWVTDRQRIKMILALVDAGFADNLLISSDYIGRVNTAVGEVNFYPGPLHAREGGPGYARPLLLFVPLMRKAGVTEQTIQKITVDNPRRFLAFVPTHT